MGGGLRGAIFIKYSLFKSIVQYRESARYLNFQPPDPISDPVGDEDNGEGDQQMLSDDLPGRFSLAFGHENTKGDKDRHAPCQTDCDSGAKRK